MVEQTRQLTVLCALLLLAGCASSGRAMRAGDVIEAPAEQATSDATGSADVVVDVPSRSRQAGAVALQTQASREQAEGDLSRAAATLERALRIDPEDPQLWLALAKVRLAQGDTAQAVDLARRSASLAPSDSPVHRRALDLQRQTDMAPGPGR